MNFLVLKILKGGIEMTFELNKYAIWKDHKVIDYIFLTEEQRQKINSIPDLGVYIGFDRVIKPEMYVDKDQCNQNEIVISKNYSERAYNNIMKLINEHKDTRPKYIHYHNDSCAWFISEYGFLYMFSAKAMRFNGSSRLHYAIYKYIVKNNGEVAEIAMLSGFNGTNEYGFFDTIEAAHAALKSLDGKKDGELNE